MKLKYIALVLMLTVIISGVASADPSPALRKMPGNLHEMIHLQYREALSPYLEPSHVDFHGERPERLQYTGRPGMDLEKAILVLDENIKKAEVISTRLEMGIRKLQEDGKDVSKLETLLEEYSSLVEEAKQYRTLAEEAYGSAETDSEKPGRDYLIGSQKKMMAADRVLKDIFQEFHHTTPGTEELDGTEKLTARGEGLAVLSGSFKIEMQLENTGLIIPEMTPDSAFYIKGDYEVREMSETGRKKSVYIISSAGVEITGAYKTVMLKSENLSLTVKEGKGYTALFGNGTYSIENEEGLKEEKNWGGFFFENQPKIGQGPELMKPGMMNPIRLSPDKPDAPDIPGPEIGKIISLNPEKKPTDRPDKLEKNPENSGNNTKQ